jgi:hypothetical protein
MVEERKKDKKGLKKAQRLKVLVGLDICACAGGHKLQCHGVCRESHQDVTGRVSCGELYRIEDSEIKSDKPKRNWKKNRDTDRDESKQNRLKKRERDFPQ